MDSNYSVRQRPVADHVRLSEALRQAGLPDDSSQAAAGAIEVVYPGSGTVIDSVPNADAAAVDAAVQHAQQIFDQGDWTGLSPAARVAALRRFADGIDGHREQLALRDTLDMGRPIPQARKDPSIAANYIRAAAELALSTSSGKLWNAGGSTFALNEHVPVGVVAAISAWNYPVIVAATKIAAPLAAGNCVILKPSELAPHSSLLLGEIARSAGIPVGALTVLTGDGSTGSLLAAHPGVDLVTFTGSSATGKAVMTAASTNLKRIVLECGGKSPHLVFADTGDLRYVASAIAAGIMQNSGQLCTAGSRVLVERTVHQPLLALLRDALALYQPSDPLDDSTQVGPLVTASAGRRVRSVIEHALREGARNLLPETPSEIPDAYVHPALLDDVRASSRLFTEETFGPVLCATEFHDEDEVVALANSTPYGLVSTVWTTDRGRAFRLRRRLESGCIVLRSGDPNEVQMDEPPWEPARQSGFGLEAGPGSLQTFQRVSAVLVQMP